MALVIQRRSSRIHAQKIIKNSLIIKDLLSYMGEIREQCRIQGYGSERQIKTSYYIYRTVYTIYSTLFAEFQIMSFVFHPLKFCKFVNTTIERGRCLIQEMSEFGIQKKKIQTFTKLYQKYIAICRKYFITNSYNRLAISRINLPSEILRQIAAYY